MSNDVRRYDPDTDWFEDADPLTVTAVMGSQRTPPEGEDPDEWDGHGRSVQLTLGRGPAASYTILTEAQALDLIASLSKRLACSDDFAATAWLDEELVHPDGSTEVFDVW